MVQHISETVAKDEGRLKQEVQRLFDDQTKLLDETQGTGSYYVPGVHYTVCGVFVIVQSGYGAVRVLGKDQTLHENVITSPNEKEQYCIIMVEPGQECGILGKPSYRLIIR
ncbi:uncharacterized protein FPRO_15999 [Fusarium proliferatum ET1]|uniref:Uncharacterized protein n=1 Tax=Fusarium proliferatum (strain ET1) TaxID=1227346 RepID=A0A1L7WB10_FUSPR|nr:uncharacterized protein FPRO_15999 [Fusarium proliferatum ET1]CZR49790.1 uncharacterized protein FPRO_15999 [Fusarium proliferatum ET1]